MKKLGALTLAAIGAAVLALPGGAAAGGNFNSTINWIDASKAGGGEVLASGKVEANRNACRSGREIDMQLFQNGDWRTVDTIKSSKAGAFALIFDIGMATENVRGKMHSKRIDAGTCDGDVAVLPL